MADVGRIDPTILKKDKSYRAVFGKLSMDIFVGDTGVTLVVNGGIFNIVPTHANAINLIPLNLTKLPTNVAQHLSSRPPSIGPK